MSEHKAAIPHLDYLLSGRQAVHWGRVTRSIIDLVDFARTISDVRPDRFKVLDIGCGRGELLRELSLKGYSAVGLDMDERGVDLSRRFAPCVHGNAEDIAEFFDQEAFDMVVLSHIIEHVRAPLSILEKTRHVSRRWICIAVPNPVRPVVLLRSLLRRPRPDHSTHLQVWDSGHLMGLIANAGLREVRWGRGSVGVFPLTVPRAVGLFVDWLETSLLGGLFPHMVSSLNLLCEKDTLNG